MAVKPEIRGPSSPAEPAVGWRPVPDEPPGTFVWWDGEKDVVVAFWAVDHWEYVTEEWSGPDPAPGVLPAGAHSPRKAGWRQSSDGRWHAPLPRPPDLDRSVKFGVWALVVVTVPWLLVLARFFLGFMLFPPAMVVGGILGLLALTSPTRGRHRTLGRMLGGVAVTVAGLSLLAFLLLMIALMSMVPDM